MQNLARRAGLLHDIGKALDHDMEGTHVEIGVEILKKYKENPISYKCCRSTSWRCRTTNIRSCISTSSRCNICIKTRS